MTLWGGRFGGPASKGTWDFTTDDSDRRLLAVDIQGSLAHAAMLGDTGIISTEDAASLESGLLSIAGEASAGEFAFLESDEDVHSAVERRLGEVAGEVAGKLHTGRSRNDQIALDMRLYLAHSAADRAGGLRALALQLADVASIHAETVIPSYTHLQQAQATTLGHHLLAYAWMLLRGAERFDEARSRIARSPLGAGASSGSSLPLDREAVARSLGLEGVIENSLDAVGSRDFVSEYVFCCAQTMIDLSRFAEEMIIWASKEFGWLTLSDAVSTGSSALPQKRNPDIAELIRGRAGSVAGDMAAILALQKSLPLAYNRDLQEDKRIVFHADDVLAAAVRAMGDLLGGVVFDPPAPAPETAALDLAEALVRRGVPFREAHELVGGLVSRAEERGLTLADVTVDDLEAIDDRFEEDDLRLLDPSESLARRASSGSGSPESVRSQIEQIRALARLATDP
ncbi:MAG: argininosuccinate lyase [Actinomycetota bacterium]|nr:argininosuccinate lyase [Actinomycetota bacterium]